MAKKLIAIAFSDLHINQWKKFNKNGTRTMSHFLVLKKIFRKAIKLKVPLLFCGDWVHKPQSIDMELLISASEIYDQFSNEIKLQVYGINGNHDLPKPNSFNNPTKGYLHALQLSTHWMNCMDFKTELFNDFALHGIPYIDHNIDLRRAIKSLKVAKDRPNILMLHTDYYGAKDNDGREIFSTSIENIDKSQFKKFDLVLCGHIHKPQKLGKNFYMVGAPLQQRFTDEGSELGYLKIYRDFSVKYISIPTSPKFITSEEIPDDPEGDYYRTLPNIDKINQSITLQAKVKPSFSKNKMVRQYFREKGIKDKKKKQLLIKLFKESEDD